MPSIPTPAENPELYSNRNGEVLGASVTLLALPTIFVALRLLSRYMAGAGLWVRYIYAEGRHLSSADTCQWDDAFVILGMVSRGSNSSKKDVLAARD